MTLRIEIEMENAAFEDAPENEAARILAHVAAVILKGNLGMSAGASMPLRDVNGNTVGKAEVVE